MRTRTEFSTRGTTGIGRYFMADSKETVRAARDGTCQIR